ncbi:class I SAM-dependent methyltransferase [soil metagenome]
MAEATIDQEKSEAFAGLMVDVLNHGAIALMTSIGFQTGLFEAMAGQPPKTSNQVAESAGLNERYVREWLAAMATGRILEHDSIANTYQLPAEHSAWLTEAAGPDNLALQTQFIPLLALVEDPLIECFRNGGGVPYSQYPKLLEVIGQSSGAVNDAALIDTILPLVAGLPERLRDGIDVADIGCGRGHAINLMAQAFPKSRFVGYDYTEESVAAARAEAAALALTNATFEKKDVSQIDDHERFDLITAFDAIHDQAKPARVLTAINQALRPDGVFLMVDIMASSHVHENMDHMLGPLLYTISCMHCMTVSLAMDGQGLGAMWGEQTALRMLEDAGFGKVDIAQVEGDILNNYYIARNVDGHSARTI